MSASEPTCLHDWRAANWIMTVNYNILNENRESAHKT
jgi:hypothetical protein